MSGRGWCIPALLLLAIPLLSQPAIAFYNWRGEQAELELRGVTRFYATRQQNPSPNLIYRQENKTHWAALARFLVDGRLGSHFTLTGNLLEAAGSVVAESLASVIDTQRSGALYQSQHDTGNARAFMVVDNLAGQWTTSHLDFTVGRQPVNLATTFYFAPNDFFAPFAAQEFYRVYKPGVDAARAEIRLGNLSQLTLLAVLGYSPDPTTDSGWSREPDYHRTSYVSRISGTALDFEGALLVGLVEDVEVVGGSLQGELFDWLGLRAEGHHGAPRDGRTEYDELAGGIEHRFESSLTVRLEHFYHGRGHPDMTAANLALLGGEPLPGYLGRSYSGLGASYEFTPLVTGQLLLLANLSDHSQLLSGNLVYSLSDESELVATFNLPRGDEPAGLTLNSEYGSLPRSLLLEYRLFF